MHAYIFGLFICNIFKGGENDSDNQINDDSFISEPNSLQNTMILENAEPEVDEEFANELGLVEISYFIFFCRCKKQC